MDILALLTSELGVGRGQVEFRLLPDIVKKRLEH